MPAPTYQSTNATSFASAAGATKGTASHAVTAGDVLVAAMAGESQEGVGALTVSGGSLTWTPRQAGVLANYSPVALSTAAVAGGGSITETIARAVSLSVQAFGGAVLRFTNSAGIGNSNLASGASGNPTAAITTTQANSALVLVCADWNAVAGTPAYAAINGQAGIPVADYPGDGATYGAHIAYYSDAGAIGAKTITVTGITNPKWQLAVVEVLGVASGPVSVSLVGLLSAALLRAVSIRLPLPFPANLQSFLRADSIKVPVRNKAPFQAQSFLNPPLISLPRSVPLNGISVTTNLNSSGIVVSTFSVLLEWNDITPGSEDGYRLRWGTTSGGALPDIDRSGSKHSIVSDQFRAIKKHNVLLASVWVGSRSRADMVSRANIWPSSVRRVILAALLLFASGAATAATINAATCSEANVNTAINTAAVGDTVQVPAGSCTWSALSLNKAITLKGAGIGVTNITLGTGGSITKQSAGITRVRDFSFSRSGGGNTSVGFVIGGAWKTAKPIVFQNNAVTISGSGMFRVTVTGGFIVANNSFTAEWDDSILKVVNVGSLGDWTTASTMGTLDTNGEWNNYVEDNTFYGGTNQGIDCDDSCRVVYRHNDLTYSSFNSHGYDSSDTGARHWEIYNNTWHYPGGNSNQITNQNWAIWIRGGTGVIYNNAIAELDGYWGYKSEYNFSIRGAEDYASKVFGSCGAASYPAPRQLGQGHNGTSYVLDPIYLWGNTGPTDTIAGGWNWGNPCGLTWTNFYQQNRDWYSGSTKPGYIAYAYPHPLVQAAPDTEVPSTVSGLGATTASSTQINLSWTSATDNVGVAGYNVERCSGAACANFAEITQTTGTGTTFSNTSLTASTLYRYRIKARDAAGNVSAAYSNIAEATTSAADTAVPSTVTGLSATAISTSQINLSWTAATDNVGIAGYDIERCSGAACANFAQVNQTTGTGTTWNNTTGLSASTLYRYRVKARDTSGNVSAAYSNISEDTTSTASGPPTLPEGSGLAAAYPNDSGITGNSAVLFAEGFDSYTAVSQLTSSGNWSNYFQGGNMLLDTGTFYGGTKALRIRMPSSGGEVSNAIVKPISPSRDVLFVRAYVRYAANYAGMNSAHNGIRVTANYSGPGTIPNGSDFFYVSVENSRYRSETEPGYTNAYVYHPEQNDAYGEHWYPSGFVGNGAGPDGGFGAYFVARSDISPTRGQWLCYEVMVQANTPGSRDGRVAVWEDGVLIADWQNVRFRDVGTVKINEIQFENGGQGSTQINDKWYDNIVVATEYIGPVQSSFLPAPTNLRWELR